MRNLVFVVSMVLFFGLLILGFVVAWFVWYGLGSEYYISMSQALSSFDISGPMKPLIMLLPGFFRGLISILVGILLPIFGAIVFSRISNWYERRAKESIAQQTNEETQKQVNQRMKDYYSDSWRKRR